MADKKITKITTSKADLSLSEQLAEKRKELIEAKRGLAAGELQNPRTIGKIRKDIARILAQQNSNNESGATGDGGSAEAPRAEGKPSVAPQKRSAKKGDK